MYKNTNNRDLLEKIEVYFSDIWEITSKGKRKMNLNAIN